MKNLFEKYFTRKMENTVENDKKGSKKNLPNRSGFTLVEILIVVAVIGILFVTLVPRIDFAGDKGAMCCYAA